MTAGFVHCFSYKVCCVGLFVVIIAWQYTFSMLCKGCRPCERTKLVVAKTTKEVMGDMKILNIPMESLMKEWKNENPKPHSFLAFMITTLLHDVLSIQTRFLWLLTFISSLSGDGMLISCIPWFVVGYSWVPLRELIFSAVVHSKAMIFALHHFWHNPNIYHLFSAFSPFQMFSFACDASINYHHICYVPTYTRKSYIQLHKQLTAPTATNWPFVATTTPAHNPVNHIFAESQCTRVSLTWPSWHFSQKIKYLVHKRGIRCHKQVMCMESI